MPERRASRALGPLVALILAFTCMATAIAYVVFQQSDANQRISQQQGRITRAVQAIQSERRSVIRSACQEQNSRHRDTVRALDSLLRRAERHAPPKRIQAINASRAPTLLLIDALAPYENCRAVVRRATSDSRSP